MTIKSGFLDTLEDKKYQENSKQGGVFRQARRTYSITQNFTFFETVIEIEGFQKSDNLFDNFTEPYFDFGLEDGPFDPDTPGLGEGFSDPGWQFAQDWQPFTDYKRNALVYDCDIIYTTTQNFTSGPSFDDEPFGRWINTEGVQFNARFAENVDAEIEGDIVPNNIDTSASYRRQFSGTSLMEFHIFCKPFQISDLFVYEDDDVEVKILEDEEALNSCCAKGTKVDQIVPKDSEGDLVQEFCDIRSFYDPDQWPVFKSFGPDNLPPGVEFDRTVKTTTPAGSVFEVTQRIEGSNVKIEDPFIVKLIVKEPDRDLDYLTMDEVLNAPEYVDLPKTSEEFQAFSGSIFGILMIDAMVFKENSSTYRVSVELSYKLIAFDTDGAARDTIIPTDSKILNAAKEPFFVMTDKSLVDKQFVAKTLVTEDCP